MMNRQVFADGQLVEQTVNNGDGTATITTFAADGTVDSVVTVSGIPAEPLFPPLDPTGALATLLVVVGTLDIGDAAAAIGEEPSHLVHEAQAWQIASGA